MINCGPECEQTLREIERWLDGECDPTVHTEVQTHLSGCNPCMQRVEFRRKLKVVVQTKCTGEALPVELHDKLKGLLRTLDSSGD
jgi:mycothiol system anti-sigma-R factor